MRRSARREELFLVRVLLPFVLDGCDQNFDLRSVVAEVKRRPNECRSQQLPQHCAGSGIRVKQQD